MITISPSLLSPPRQAYHGLGSRSQGAIYKYAIYIEDAQEHQLNCDIFLAGSPAERSSMGTISSRETGGH